MEQRCYFILVTDICLPNEQTGDATKKLQKEKLFADDLCISQTHLDKDVYKRLLCKTFHINFLKYVSVVSKCNALLKYVRRVS